MFTLTATLRIMIPADVALEMLTLYMKRFDPLIKKIADVTCKVLPVNFLRETFRRDPQPLNKMCETLRPCTFTNLKPLTLVWEHVIVTPSASLWGLMVKLLTSLTTQVEFNTTSLPTNSTTVSD